MNKKKAIIIIFILVIVMSAIITTMINKNSNQTFEIGGATIALIVDGKKQNQFPIQGFYDVDVLCEGAHGKWDYHTWKLVIKKITSKISCSISFTTASKVNLNDKVKSLVGNDQVFNEKGYRYEGKKVDNYVWFNNELWRIIGVFDENRHGQSGLELTKIIRAKSIGGLSWNKTSDQNNWVESSLNKLLNEAYLNSQNGTNSEYCHGGTNVKGNCDYRENGISLEYQNMVKEVTWYLGASDTDKKTTEEMYLIEKGAIGSKTAPDVISTTGKIGLMYPSDYGYAADSNSCDRAETLESSFSCANYDWLYGQADEWTIMPHSANTYSVFSVNGFLGDVGSNVDNYGYLVRPTLYLNENVYVIGGKGTKADPYVIAMD